MPNEISGANKIGIAKKLLPKPAKIAATHALNELDFSIRNIAKILGIGDRSVQRYLDQEPAEKWLQFGHSIKKMIEVADYEVESLALAKMKELIPSLKKDDWYKLIDTIKMLRESKNPKQETAAVQVQTILADCRKEVEVVPPKLAEPTQVSKPQNTPDYLKKTFKVEEPAKPTQKPQPINPFSAEKRYLIEPPHRGSYINFPEQDLEEEFG